MARSVCCLGWVDTTAFFVRINVTGVDSASSSPVRSNSTLTGTPLAGPSNSLRAQRPSIEKKSSKKPRESGELLFLRGSIAFYESFSGASEDFWEHEPHGDGFWEEACRIAG